MKFLVIVLLLALSPVAMFSQERPKVPSDTTLASPTSQIAAWYRYALELERQIAVLTSAPSGTSGTLDSQKLDRVIADLLIVKSDLSQVKSSVTGVKSVVDKNTTTLASVGTNVTKNGDVIRSLYDFVNTVRVIVRVPFKSCEISWQDMGYQADRIFILERSVDGAVFAPIVYTPSLMYLDQNLVPATYWYRVRVKIGDVISAPSSTVSIRMFSD